MEERTKWVIVAVFLIIVIIIFIISSLIGRYKGKLQESRHLLDKSVAEKDAKIKELELTMQTIQANLKGNAQDLAKKWLDEWKEKELEEHRKVIIRAAVEKAESLLAAWKITEGDRLRKDAVKRSMGVNFGKITEHLIPFSKHLEQFDPRDVRFIGSPVDLMIFDGATSKEDVIDIYLVEIKTGSGQLSKKQKTIRDAIANNRIHWLPIVVPEFKWDVPDEEDDPQSS